MIADWSGFAHNRYINRSLTDAMVAALPEEEKVYDRYANKRN